MINKMSAFAVPSPSGEGCWKVVLHIEDITGQIFREEQYTLTPLGHMNIQEMKEIGVLEVTEALEKCAHKLLRKVCPTLGTGRTTPTL
jgi:hypothetical protein